MRNERLFQTISAHPHRIFWIFLVAQILVWTLAPASTHPNAPLDVIEGLTWGHNWRWGYAKHPPLQAWLLEAIAWLSGGREWAFFLLSQATVVIAYWAVWRLASRMLDAPDAVVSVLLLASVYYFSYPTPEFNPNVLQMPFWALIGYVFYMALTTGGHRYWALTGIFAAFTMYTKYSGIMFFFPLAAFMVFEPRARARFRTAGPYIALIVGLGLYIPHIAWLYGSDFLPFSYAFARAKDADSWLDHIGFPLRFLGAQVLNHLGFFLVLFLGQGYRTSAAVDPAKAPASSFDRRYVAFLGLGPLLFALSISAVFGIEFRSMWGMPMFCFSGLLAAVYFNPALKPDKLRRAFAAWITIVVLTPLVYAGAMTFGPHLTGKGKRGHYPGAKTADAITQAWHETTGRPLRFVVGTTWVAGNIAFYSKDRPSVLIDGDERKSPWVDKAALKKAGAVVVWRRTNKEIPDRLAKQFPGAIVQQPMTFDWQTSAKLKPVLLNWAIVAPAILPATQR